MRRWEGTITTEMAKNWEEGDVSSKPQGAGKKREAGRMEKLWKSAGRIGRGQGFGDFERAVTEAGNHQKPTRGRGGRYGIWMQIREGATESGGGLMLATGMGSGEIRPETWQRRRSKKHTKEKKKIEQKTPQYQHTQPTTPHPHTPPKKKKKQPPQHQTTKHPHPTPTKTPPHPPPPPQPPPPLTEKKQSLHMVTSLGVHHSSEAALTAGR